MKILPQTPESAFPQVHCDGILLEKFLPNTVMQEITGVLLTLVSRGRAVLLVKLVVNCIYFHKLTTLSLPLFLSGVLCDL